MSMWTRLSAARYRGSGFRRWTRESRKRWATGFRRDIRWWISRRRAYDGSFHAVDSSDLAFQLAGRIGFPGGDGQGAIRCCWSRSMDMEIVVPEEFMGDVIGDMNSRRGKIGGMEPIGGGRQRIKAQVPQARDADLFDRPALDSSRTGQVLGEVFAL